MGTINDWIVVAFMGGFWGGAMALMTGPRKAPDGTKTGWSWADVVSWTLAGLVFGIGMTFRWQAFHIPHLLVMVAALVGSILTARLAPLKPPPVDKSPYRQ
jgi:hypothetical protein